MTFEQKKIEDNRTFYKDYDYFCDNENIKINPTVKNEKDEVLNTKNFSYQCNNQKNVNQKHFLEEEETNFSTRKPDSENQKFILSITSMLNSIKGINYKSKKMISCPDMEFFENYYSSDSNYKKLSLFDIFTFRSKKNEDIINGVIQQEEKLNKNVFRSLMKMTFQEIFDYYINDCKVVVFGQYAFVLSDYFYTPEDTYINIKESNQIEMIGKIVKRIKQNTKKGKKK